jgi:hypothetical protein
MKSWFYFHTVNHIAHIQTNIVCIHTQSSVLSLAGKTWQAKTNVLYICSCKQLYHADIIFGYIEVHISKHVQWKHSTNLVVDIKIYLQIINANFEFRKLFTKQYMLWRSIVFIKRVFYIVTFVSWNIVCIEFQY